MATAGLNHHIVIYFQRDICSVKIIDLTGLMKTNPGYFWHYWLTGVGSVVLPSAPSFLGILSINISNIKRRLAFTAIWFNDCRKLSMKFLISNKLSTCAHLSSFGMWSILVGCLQPHLVNITSLHQTSHSFIVSSADLRSFRSLAAQLKRSSQPG